MEPIWLTKEIVLAIHDRQLAEHGGISGTRDEGLLESALARAQNVYFYTDNSTPSLQEMAAAYAYGITRNHPFLDGNKRTGYVCTRLFLQLNGLDIIATHAEKYLTMLSLSVGDLSQEQLAAWLTDKAPK